MSKGAWAVNLPRDHRAATSHWRIAVCAALILCLNPAKALAEPLDLTDPTPRTIQVEFEISFPPATIGVTYSVSVPATYSVSGNTGTVVIAGVDYETAIQTNDIDYIDGITSYTHITGSASDFTLDINLTTLEATAQTFTYQVTLTGGPPLPQTGTVTRTLGTTNLAGFAVSPMFPTVPFFCGTCTIVPGSPYDPVTGKINAVGKDTIISADVNLALFAKAGDLRLSEDSVPSLPAHSSITLICLFLVIAVLAGMAHTSAYRLTADRKN